jgi:hypothetical protein
MKRLTILLIVIVSLTNCEQALIAQYFNIPGEKSKENPRNFNQDIESPSGISGTGWNHILSGPENSPRWSTVQNIPFTFKFNGINVNQFKVSSSGILTFDINSLLNPPEYTRVILPHSSIPNSSICISGLNGKGGNDIIATKVFGTAPTRQFWVSFNSYGFDNVVSDGSNFTYWSIVLEEGNDMIYIVDQRTLGFDGEQFVSGGIQINTASYSNIQGSPNLPSKSNGNSYSSDNVYYTFVQGERSASDIQLTETLTKNVYFGYNYPKVRIRNIGTDTLRQISYNYKLDGSQSGTAILRNLVLAPLDTFVVLHPEPFNMEYESSILELHVFLPNNTSDPTENNSDINQYMTKKAPFDLKLQIINLPKHNASDSLTPIALITNLGTEPINGFSYCYSMDDGPLNCESISRYIPPTTASNSSPVALNKLKVLPGHHQLKFYIQNLSDEYNKPATDQLNYHDTVIWNMFGVMDTVLKIPLFENKSSSTCPPCYNSNLAFHNALDTVPSENYNLVSYQYHFPYPGDPYSTFESVSKKYTDMLPIKLINSQEIHPIKTTYETYQKELQNLSFYRLEGRYARNENEFHIQIDLESFVPGFISDSIRLYVAIVETITTNNAKGNKEKIFYNVLKKMIPDHQGINFPSPDLHEKASFQFQYTFKGNYRLPKGSLDWVDHEIEHSVESFENLRVIAWLSNLNQTQMFQSVNCKYQADLSLSEKKINIQEIMLFPNPVKNELLISFPDSFEFAQIEITNNLGNRMSVEAVTENSSTIRLNTDTLSPGYYRLVVRNTRGEQLNKSFVKL